MTEQQTGESETALMRMTSPNLQIHKIDLHPETTEYWEISPVALAPFLATPEVTRLDFYSIAECRLTRKLAGAISTDTGIKIPSEHFGLI